MFGKRGNSSRVTVWQGPGKDLPPLCRTDGASVIKRVQAGETTLPWQYKWNQIIMLQKNKCQCVHELAAIQRLYKIPLKKTARACKAEKVACGLNQKEGCWKSMKPSTKPQRETSEKVQGLAGYCFGLYARKLGLSDYVLSFSCSVSLCICVWASRQTEHCNSWLGRWLVSSFEGGKVLDGWNRVCLITCQVSSPASR